MQNRTRVRRLGHLLTIGTLIVLSAGSVYAQGVTTSAINGFVTDESGSPLPGAIVKAVHQPSGTQYTTIVRSGGAFTIPNMRIGGPYVVTAELIGRRTESKEDVHLQLAQTMRLDFALRAQAVQIQALDVIAERDRVFNSGRTGAATYLDAREITLLPSVKRSTRDLIRLDPRNDGNFSFAGRNWLYNNISLDGSYFNNPFGLDDPAPGGQAAAEPVPYDAVEQVQVSVAPFDVREGGFTGANINTVTKSGTNQFRGSVYTFGRNESLIGNTVRGAEVIANPELSFNQSGFTLSGPLMRNRLFFFLNGEIERREDPGSNFVADRGAGVDFGESRASAAVLDLIRQRMLAAYNYDTGPYDGFVHKTNNDKLLLKFDWNVNATNNFTFRYNFLDARRDLPPHPFVLSFNNTGRGPNASSLPFQNAGYRINNELHSFALELNSRWNSMANRFFASYNRFRDFREPFSEDFPTIDIGEGGVQLTTIGHEPFSIHNILDQDVLQFTNNLSIFRGKHVFTVGANFERFGFFNSFNIFRHGVFFLPDSTIGSTFSSVQDFLNRTDPNNPNRIQFRNMIGSGPFKGEKIDVGQLGLYAQDEFAVTRNLTLTYGLRVDVPMYFTNPVDNPFSRGLTALDENRQSEIVDQSRLPGNSPLFSPRVGFNWDVQGDRSMQLRGGTGIFTGRVPFVWVGNVISNPGANANLWGPFNTSGRQIETSDDAILQQSFDLNAMDPDFKWPQVWTTNLAVDKRLPWQMSGTLELLYGKDLNSVFMRNADLVPERRRLLDGRPFYGGFGANELNGNGGGAGIYVIDNSSDGHNLNITAQLRKTFQPAAAAQLSYSYTQARNRLKSTEIASVLWQNQPIQGDPNNPELSFSEFGHRHRIVGAGTYAKQWSSALATNIGLFLEVAEGNRFAGSGGNRYSFIYAGDVNGDGQGGNDLIYIPQDQADIRLETYTSGTRTVTAQEQWTLLNAFIEQDNYLSKHRGGIAERFGGVNPWYSNIDLRILQDISFNAASRRQTIQVNLDLLNVANLISSKWGVRKVADPAATSPLRLVRFDGSGEPVLNFVGPARTYIDDPSIYSRWQVQLGLKYLVN